MLAWWPLTNLSTSQDFAGDNHISSEPDTFIDGPDQLSPPYVQIEENVKYTCPTNGILGWSESFAIFMILNPIVNTTTEQTNTYNSTIFHFGEDGFALHLSPDKQSLLIDLGDREVISINDILNLNEWNWIGVSYDFITSKLMVWKEDHVRYIKTVLQYNGGPYTKGNADFFIGDSSHGYSGGIGCLQIYNHPVNVHRVRTIMKRCGWPYDLPLKGEFHTVYLLR